jgi:hypothetical protein
MLLTDHDSVNQILEPLKQQSWCIPNQGTTKLANTGRVGNWIEQQFGIKQNCSTKPDSAYAELKTLGVTGKRPMASIGNVSWEEYQKIRDSSYNHWCTSEPMKKMQRTLWVFWLYEDQYSHSPRYRIQSWHYLDFNELDFNTKLILDNDYEACCREIQRRSYGRSRTVSGHYLALGTKGDSDYVYPNWKFTSRFVDLIRCNKLALQLG